MGAQSLRLAELIGAVTLYTKDLRTHRMVESRYEAVKISVATGVAGGERGFGIGGKRKTGESHAHRGDNSACDFSLMRAHFAG